MKCEVCKKTNSGACVQCPNDNCTKAFHPECARRAGLNLEYRFSDAPYWRIYCQQHAVFRIKKIVNNLINRKHDSITNFCRTVDRFYASFGELNYSN